MVSAQSKCSRRHDKVQGSAFGSIVDVAAHWNVHVEGDKSELADRATLRQVGTVPRHKVSTVKSLTERVFFLFMCQRIEGISFRCT